MTLITATASSSRPVGALLREWRQRRRLSQLDLACEADISTKHLSFLETGRSVPSRDMVLHLAERLDVPLRARNVLLHAAGYAPVFPERPLDDAALGAVRQAVDLGLTSMADLYKELGVGTCCGKCVSYAREVMHEHLESKTVVTELRRAPADGIVA